MTRVLFLPPWQEENPRKGAVLDLAPLLVAIGAFLEKVLRGELGLSGVMVMHGARRGRYVRPLSYWAVYSPIGLV